MRRLCLAAGLAYASYSICRTPLLPLLASALGAGPLIVGAVVAASTVTGVIVKLPAGVLSDLVGRRPMLLAGAAVFALVPLSYLAVSTLGALILVRFVHGNATAIFGPVASATVSDLAPQGRRGAWLSTYGTAQGVGQAIGPIVAGYLLASDRVDGAFLIAGVLGSLAFLAVAGVPADRPRLDGGARWTAFRAGIREVAQNRIVMVTSAAHAAQFFVNGALAAFLPLYARDVIGLTTPELGWLFAAQTATTLVARPMLGIMSDVLGRRPVIVTGLLVCSGVVAALPSVVTGVQLAACVLTYAAGVATTSAATSALVTDATRQARYGAAHGVFGTIYDVGDALGPLAAGLLVAGWGYGPMFRWTAGVGAVMAVIFALGSRERAMLPGP